MLPDRMSRPLPADLLEVRLRLARDEGMAEAAVVVTELPWADGATVLRRPDVEPPAAVAVRVAERPPLRRVLCCLLIAASRRL